MGSEISLVAQNIRLYVKFRHLLLTFIKSDLKDRYAGSLLGIFWTIINPLIMILIYTFVFSVVLKVEFHGNRSPLDFALYLVCGMLPWFAMQESVIRSAGIIEENASLVKKANFPSGLLPAYVVIGNLFTMLVTLLLFLAFVILRMQTFSATLIYLPAIIFLQLLFTLGLSWGAAGLNVIFPDTKPLLQNFMLLGMFVTPVFYPSAMFPRELSFVLAINPFAHIVDLYRETIMKNHLPLESFMSLAAAAVFAFAVGYYFFVKMQPKFVDLM